MTKRKRRKRIDHHQNVLDGVENFLYNLPDQPVVVQLHSRAVRYMPKTLKGVPDLIVSTMNHTIYCEIKPLYLKSRRDTLKTEQALFAMDMYPKVSQHLRYWIVESASEFVSCWEHDCQWYAQEYHLNTMTKVALEEGVELPW